MTTVAALIAAVIGVAASNVFGNSANPLECEALQLRSLGVASGGIRADSIGGECSIPTWRPFGIGYVFTNGVWACDSFSNTASSGWKYLKRTGDRVCTLIDLPSTGDTLIGFGSVPSHDGLRGYPVIPKGAL